MAPLATAAISISGKSILGLPHRNCHPGEGGFLRLRSPVTCSSVHSVVSFSNALSSARIVALLAILPLGGCAVSSGLNSPLPHVSGIHSIAFKQEIGTLLGPSWSHGNKITPLNNGDEIFPAMLAAIRGARKSVNFETFVYSTGEIPEQFNAAFIDRARAGVKVNLIFDAFGCIPSTPYLAELRAAGVNLEIYHSVWGVSLKRYFYRTHRKHLIVDGRIGFVGGVGIDDRWKGNARNPAERREVHFKVEGPVVAQLQGGFAENWLKTKGEVLQGPDYYPPLSPAGPIMAAAFQSAPGHNRFNMELMYHLSISSAKRSLLIGNAYFLPVPPLVKALCQAAQRGVRVIILVPGPHMDAPAVTRASKKYWPELLEAGVRIYQYQPTMYHNKVFIADGLFVSIGSGNVDPRSLRYNDENNLNILDAPFARKLTQTFFNDLRESKPVRGRDATLADLPELLLQTLELPIEGQL